MIFSNYKRESNNKWVCLSGEYQGFIDLVHSDEGWHFERWYSGEDCNPSKEWHTDVYPTRKESIEAMQTETLVWTEFN